jgi:presenilin-like A22 family membrane protease
MDEEEEREEKRASIALFIGMGSFILLTQIIALLLAAPFDLAGVTAFENPDDPLNPIIFFIFIIAFTAFILVVLRFGGKRLVYFVMLAAVTITIYYVMAVIIPYVVIPEVCTLALALLLFKYPEWYVLDATGLIIGGGAAAIFGISLGILPVLLLLIILAVYDAIAVYKTKHMISLAESVIDLRMPILFVLPRKWSFSLMKGDEMEDGFFMGLGDAIIPSVLVVSAFVNYELATPTLGALVGTLAGYAVLSTIAGRGKPHAGLPFLNSGAILGFAIGYMAMMV